MLVPMQKWRFQRKIHSSWLIAALSLALVIGTALVPLIDNTLFSGMAWIIVATMITLLVLWRRSIYLLPLIVLAGLLGGLWRGSVVASDIAAYEGIYGKVITLSGRVSDDVDSGRHGELVLRLHEIVIGDHHVAGKAWISISTNADIKRGDVVVVKAKAQKGFGSFSIVAYRASLVSVKRPEPGDVARQVRDWFASNVQKAVSEPAASLGLGYLLGQKRALPDELQQALVITGLTHVVVASGYNLTILVRLARRLFEKISKYLSALFATMMIIGFIAVTGASPSMSRAGLVAGLSLAAWYYGRRFHPLVLLPFAAAVTVLVDPTYAWNDLGWQLSFAAFAGVMIMAPLLQVYFFGDKKPGIIRQILGETISASIVTLPILVLAFGSLSNVAVIANLLVLPLVPLAMLLTFIAGLSTVILPQFAELFGLPAEWLLKYMLMVIDYLAGLSWAQSTVDITAWMAWLAYALIIAACIYLWRVTKYDLGRTNLVE